MKTHIAVIGTLPMLLCAAVAGAQLQTLTPPPLKMGLWQSTVTMQMAGMPNMPAGAASPLGKPMMRQYCIDSSSWQKAMITSQQQQQTADCSMTNVQQDAHHLAFDEACSAKGGMTVSVHMQMTWDNDESAHGAFTSKVTGGSQAAQAMAMNLTVDSKFVSADCGGLKPGESKSVNQ